MPALFFPNPDALRLVLASGVLPAAVTAAPARAGWDALGRLWVEPAAPIPQSTLAALGRFGVQTLGGGHPTPEQVGGWAELLPLRPATGPLGNQVLFELPDELVGRFLRALSRGGPRPVGVRQLPGEDRRTWVRCENPPADLVDRATEPGVELFTEQARGVWVIAGWEHPYPDGFTLPPGHVLLLRPPRSVTFHAGVPDPKLESFAVAGPATARPPDRVLPRIEVRVRLRRSAEPAEPQLWVVPNADAEAVRQLCREAAERTLAGYEVAVCRDGLVVRCAGPAAGPLPILLRGYQPDPLAAGCFVPAGHALHPPLRPRELARLLNIRDDHLTWADAAGAELVTRSVPRSAFRPLTGWVSYTAPTATPLVASGVWPDPFALAGFDADTPDEADDTTLDEVELAPLPAYPLDESQLDPAAHGGWLSRTLGRLAAWRPAKPTAPRPSAAAATRPASPAASVDVLLHGADRAARRQQLEARLVRSVHRLGPEERAAAWAELAGVYGATGNAGDAAVCWANAAWEADAPPTDWLDEWYAAECRSARRPPAEPLERLLADPGRVGVARVVAAYTARAAFAAQPPAELIGELPRVLALLDERFDDLPARSAWLARRGATRLSGGDALGLARWRDRLVARLREKGPGLDLDGPSFLRFHGTASPERFRTARDWLVRVKKPVVDWVERLGPAGRLRAVGIDPETECTAAYAQLMLAWGLGCLGERSLSVDWAARARKALGRAAGPGVEPETHAVLSGLFADRIRGVQDGRPPAGGIPADLLPRYDALPLLARHAVDRLRDHSRVLEPVREGVGFRGYDVRPVRGTDRLGERLQLLADNTDPTTSRREARELLDVCAADPCSATVPRVALTLLDASGRLDEGAVRETLGHVVPAATWFDAWLQVGRWTEAERVDRLPKYLARLFVGAAGAAARYGLAAELRPVADYLARHAGAQATVRAALVRSARPVFRAFHKLGMSADSAAILDRLDPDRGNWPADAPLPPARLGIAVGWFAAGDDDAATRLLDDARRRLLFAPKSDDDRDRTELAIGYADALGFAPPRVALGRLEELFQQLDRVSTTGSTNRYFTLKPLELVDTVVRAVVTDDFALGPAVRGWLADDEFLIRRRIHRDMAAARRDGAGE
ncbi:hypothetical protein [Urbifossiella limnaea]|uniref:FtsH ternary system domain-containing protein n=1 Tax=Urbifossiella limnaea TaxID=2528023 RepID=A0A517XT90_9BACT|nr:hypothetical protein [Urbifossiella limnaea]QDU20694.1 hypothetical protein ETAA1_26510 [Urbifossiella limnaea]